MKDDGASTPHNADGAYSAPHNDGGAFSAPDDEMDGSSAAPSETSETPSASTKPKFKKRSEMTSEERKADNARKRAREAKAKEEARAAGKYHKAKKLKAGKYAIDFRYPQRWSDKITLADYKAIMAEFGSRSIAAAMGIAKDGELLDEAETCLGSGMWVEFGDRSRDLTAIPPHKRLGHIFFGYESFAAGAMTRHQQVVADAVHALGIKPVALEEKDPRAKWSTSINAAIWEGTGTTPAERAEKFLYILGALRGHQYPREGTSVVAAFPNPDNPFYTRLIIKVSPKVPHEMGFSPS